MKPNHQIPLELVHRYISLPEEHLILAKRKHWFVLFEPLLFLFLLTVGINILSFFGFVKLLNSFLLYFLGTIVLLSITTSIGVKLLTDWCCHFYIVTTRKILEINCAPLFSESINDVFLDQVRATETDIRIPHILAEMLDMGDVIVSFDRPSHDEVFVLKDIEDPRGTGIFLGDTLESLMHDTPVWFPRRKVNPLQFADDFSPEGRLVKN